MRRKKQSLIESVEQMDASKKVNPLDLSSDQDLTIALMNLIAIEDGFVAPSELIDFVRNIRQDLMVRIVEKSGDVWNASWQLLAVSGQLIDQGNQLLEQGKQADAHKVFDRAYEVYSLFWGLNMGMLEIKDVQKNVPEIKK